VWSYIKAKQLQSPSDRRLVMPDDQLSEIVGSGSINFSGIASQISRFMIARHAPKEEAEAAKLGVSFFPHL
jgi:chromatin remodeling complex protein RSC6